MVSCNFGRERVQRGGDGGVGGLGTTFGPFEPREVCCTEHGANPGKVGVYGPF